MFGQLPSSDAKDWSTLWLPNIESFLGQIYLKPVPWFVKYILCRLKEVSLVAKGSESVVRDPSKLREKGASAPMVRLST
jgi:hypothetical protein